MPPRRKPAKSLAEAPPIAERDFLAFERHKWSDPEANPERLLLKRKLQAIGEGLNARLAVAGGDLTLRTSIHNPYTYNGNRVDSLWLYLAPSDKEKKALRDLLGVEFASDTDASYVHANLVLEIDYHGLNLGLRVHERAWWDTQNLKGRCSERKGAEEFAGLLDGVVGEYALRIHDWPAKHAVRGMKWDGLMGVLRHFEPGQHRLRIWRSIAKADPEWRDPAFYERVAEEFVSLLPVYRFIVWSPTNNFLGMKR